jgi:cyclopropane fatty-acyl-phospholipid synthase-like methyltransferase
MTLIDKKYQQQLNRMHARGKFNNGAKAYKIVEKFINQYQPTSVLDFGCGKGALIAGINEFHPAMFTQGYDPGNPDFSVLPDRTFDAVVSTDALEHVELAHLDKTLQMIGSKIERCGFFRIACYPAKKKLPDGRNAHLIVELPEWWRAKV